MLGVVALCASLVGMLYEPGLQMDGADMGTMGATGFTAAAGADVRAAAERRPIVSRGAQRRGLGEPTRRSMVAAAEQQALERAIALAKVAAQARAQSARIKRDRWTLPVDYVALTATFGESGLWANLHTGLDFNADEGDPIYSVANGTVTAAGYDGSYGNKTVVTLDDGTEIWYCHQSAILVSAGETVRGGEVIGAVGSTGNVTGSHLHLEVRPGGGSPIDPLGVFAAQGLL